MTVETNHRVAACAAPTPTGCAAHTRVWRDGRLVAEGVPVADLSDHLAEPGAIVWLDLLRPDQADMAVLTEEFGLHPLAIEDALHDHQRAKMDHYADHDFLAAYAAQRCTGDTGSLLETGELAAFFTGSGLITVRKSALVELQPLLDRWDATAQLAGSGVAYLAHGLVDHLVDGHSDAVALLDDEQLAPYLRDVDDHVQRTVESIDSLRDVLGTILDTNLTLASNRLNETIFRLTAYAAILAATTAITGYFGQNVPFPGSQETSGFVGSTVLLVVSVVGLVAFFRRKGWL